MVRSRYGGGTVTPGGKWVRYPSKLDEVINGNSHVDAYGKLWLSPCRFQDLDGEMSIFLVACTYRQCVNTILFAVAPSRLSIIYYMRSSLSIVKHVVGVQLLRMVQGRYLSQFDETYHGLTTNRQAHRPLLNSSSVVVLFHSINSCLTLSFGYKAYQVQASLT